MAKNSPEQLAVALEIVAASLGRITAAQWASPSLCAGWTVKDVTAHLVWRVGSSSLVFLEDMTRATIEGRHVNPMKSMNDIARSVASKRTTGELVADLLLIADDKRSGHGRLNSGELLEVVVHGYDAAQPLGIRLGFDDATTRTVAHTAQLGASRDVRTVLAHRRLIATDAAWEIGRGEQPIHGTAESIILYLAGRRSIDAAPSNVRIVAPLPPGAPRPGLV